MTPAEKLKKVRELLEDGIFTDGAHHKQWYLSQIAEVVGIDVEIEPGEEGIAP